MPQRGGTSSGRLLHYTAWATTITRGEPDPIRCISITTACAEQRNPGSARAHDWALAFIDKNPEEAPQEMPRSPRLHDDCTLIEAAQWLSEETTEQWSTQAVLARLAREWTSQGCREHRLLPESLNVSIPPGTELESLITGERETTERWRMMFVGGAALESMLESLLQFGEATDVALVGGLRERWLCRSPLRSDCLRLSPAVIDGLVPTFDRFVQSSAGLRLVREWEAATAAEGQQDDAPEDSKEIIEEATGASPSSGAPASTNATEPAWKAQACQRAEEIIQRQRVNDWFPSQLHIADEIAREFRAAGITGLNGKPLTGSYIKRHALRGISSAQAKLQSTKPRRSK